VLLVHERPVAGAVPPIGSSRDHDPPLKVTTSGFSTEAATQKVDEAHETNPKPDGTGTGLGPGQPEAAAEPEATAKTTRPKLKTESERWTSAQSPTSGQHLPVPPVMADEGIALGGAVVRVGRSAATPRTLTWVAR
jgi:hypothetical protein